MPGGGGFFVFPTTSYPEGSHSVVGAKLATNASWQGNFRFFANVRTLLEIQTALINRRNYGQEMPRGGRISIFSPTSESPKKS